MTILTKPFSEKKGGKLEVPLVENEQSPQATAPEDVEAQKPPRILIYPARVHHVSITTTLCLLFTALVVVGIGIVGGKILYSQFISFNRDQRFQEFNEENTANFEGWAQIPLPKDDEVEDEAMEHAFVNIYNPPPNVDIEEWKSRHDPALNQLIDSMFQENFEISFDRRYEKIDVPDFRDDRRGRFIHDFNTNITGIIDITGQRCFIMPLNRDNVLPPKSLFDLIHKMWEGYYKVDTTVVRRSMKVVFPPITDTKTIGSYIANECKGMPTYKLEKSHSEITKRSAELHPEAKFAQFAGKGITELDIVNLDEVLYYEKDRQQNNLQLN